MMRLLLPLLGLLWLAQPGAPTPSIEALTIWLLPQYDDPRLLIRYEAQLAEPGEVWLGAPSGVELHAAAYRTTTGAWQPTEAHFEAASDGRFLRLTSPTREVRLELYYDVIPRAPQRFVDFTLPAQRDTIEVLRWVALFPPDAKRIVTEPPMTAQTEPPQGLLGFERAAGPLPAGEQAAQTIEWVRESSEPSFVRPEPTRTVPLVAARGPSAALRLGLGLLFMLGLGLTLNGVWRRRRAAQAGQIERPRGD